MIGEIFLTRLLIISAILFIISSENIKEVVGRWNKQINSKNTFHLLIFHYNLKTIIKMHIYLLKLKPI